VSYEAIRQWWQRFGPEYARILRRRQGRLGDTWHLDELFVNIQGRLQYLWRAVDQDGDVIDILVQPRRDRRAAERFFRKLLKGQGRAPRRLITDKLRSYSAAHGLVILCRSQHEAVREQSSGSLSSTNPPTRATDAGVQIHRSRATILVGTRHRSESLSRGPPPATGCSPPCVENPLLPCVERSDVRVLKSRSPTSKGSSRTILVNLTVPKDELLDSC